ncbi:hypothetical protein J3459_010275 [Metarhizium acridum]|nr:hypothetical protein J3459_010275 [Metarhizium acridum]
MACMHCFIKFKPFVGKDLARIYSDHVTCSPAAARQPVTTQDVRRVQKNTSNRFSKRRRNFLKKAHDLHADFNVDIYLCVRNRRNNKIWQYTSDFVPPSQDEIAIMYPIPVILSLDDFPKKEQING